VFALLRTLCAGEDVVARIVFLWARLAARGSPVDELLVGGLIGLADVTSRYQFRAAGLSMVVTPERKMSACSLSPGKNLALVAVMWVWMLKWCMSTASTSLCDFLPWFALGQSVTRW
jgi:hypothetical protein